jgi:diaminobutyrate-2-oxoglutarate transaminase
VKKSELVTRLLREIVESHAEARAWVRGRGLIQGLGFDVQGLAEQVAHLAFGRGLIIETSGSRSEVVKLLPPLTTDEDDLQDGVARLNDSLEVALERLGLKAGSHKEAQAALKI